jgi:hypothetical protein
VVVTGALRPIVRLFIFGQFLLGEFIGSFGAFVDPYRTRVSSGAVVLAAGIVSSSITQLGARTFVVFWQRQPLVRKQSIVRQLAFPLVGPR